MFIDLFILGFILGDIIIRVKRYRKAKREELQNRDNRSDS